MPSMFGKDTKKKELIAKLPNIFQDIQREHQISPGDFPNCQRMQETLVHHDFTKFHALKPKLIEVVDNMLSKDIAQLMLQIPKEEYQQTNEPLVKGGAFDGVNTTPFGVGAGEGVDAGRGEEEWIVNKDKDKYNEMFYKLNPINGKVTGAAAKSEMTKSRLPNSVLGKIWKLSDIDKDGMLDEDEFGLAFHLIGVKLDGNEIPSELPPHLIPPSKQGFAA